jgi:general secretion pathway protein F
MPNYRYRALSKTGDVISGELAAETHAVAISKLQALGHFPIAAAPAAEARDGRWRDLLTRKPDVSARQLEVLTQQLAMLVGAGLTLERALLVIAETASDSRSRMKVESLVSAVRGGASFSDALTQLGNAVPDFYRNTIRAAEEGGFLAAGLQKLTDYIGRTRVLRETVTSALIYPAILMALAVISIAVILTTVLPQFRPLFAEAKVDLPFLARTVMTLSDFTVDYPLSCLALIMAAALGGALGIAQMRRHRGDTWLDRAAVRLPAIRDIVIGFETARFSYALSLLLDNGTPLPTALSLASRIIRNGALATITSGAAPKVKEGTRLAVALASDPFPRTAIELIRAGEETGQLPQALGRIAAVYDHEAQQALSRALALLVPGLTVLLGGIVALLVASVFSALISINQVVIQ